MKHLLRDPSAPGLHSPMGSLVRNGLRILMVDDAEEDIFLVQRALASSGVGQFFHAVYDGEQAIEYLTGEGKYADRATFPFPNVILTDLKMPRMDGHSFLVWLQAHPECSIIPTIVFTSSALSQDVKTAYLTGANAYIVKPNSFQELVELVRVLHDFWSRCETPPPPQSGKCKR